MLYGGFVISCHKCGSEKVTVRQRSFNGDSWYILRCEDCKHETNL